MKIKFIRNATIWLEYAGFHILIDPMLGEKGSQKPFPNSPRQDQRNPLEDLPVPVETLLGADMVVVTHLHRDHFDRAAMDLLPRDILILAQNEADAAVIAKKGFVNVIWPQQGPEEGDFRSRSPYPEWTGPLGERLAGGAGKNKGNCGLCGLRMIRTEARHSSGEMARLSGPACGVVLTHPFEQSLYITGDSVWYDRLEEVLSVWQPEVVAASCGENIIYGADPLIMGREGVWNIHKALPGAEIIACHMESLNHWGLSKKDLRAWSRDRDFEDRLHIPENGEELAFVSETGVREAEDYLNEQKNAMIRPGLTVIRELLKELGDPQTGMNYVHIAGTNGKGSCAAYTESILRAAGYRTGLFTSPYIEHFSEKIRCGKDEISPEALVRLAGRVRRAAGILARRELWPTPFELQTALAFLYFKEMDCRIVILETGLGGRLDATNIIEETELSLITSISFDHMDYLGDSLRAIAGEKAGIIKPGGRVVCYPQAQEVREVLEEKGREQGAELHFLDTETIRILKSDLSGQRFRPEGHGVFEIRLPGLHQVYNASLAVMGVDILVERGYAIWEEHIARGLLETGWPGRMEIVHRNPLLIIDGAHNEDGVKTLCQSLEKLFPGRKIHFMVGMLRDKEYEKMIDRVLPLAKDFYAVRPDSPRALPEEELAGKLREKGASARAYASVREALDACLGLDKDQVVCAFGSLYYIGQVRAVCRSGSSEQTPSGDCLS